MKLLKHYLVSFISLSQILQEAVDDLTWKDMLTSDYVQEVTHIICNEYFKTAQTVQENFSAIEEIVQSWKSTTTETTMMDETSWPFNFVDFDTKQKFVYEYFLELF